MPLDKIKQCMSELVSNIQPIISCKVGKSRTRYKNTFDNFSTKFNSISVQWIIKETEPRGSISIDVYVDINFTWEHMGVCKVAVSCVDNNLEWKGNQIECESF